MLSNDFPPGPFRIFLFHSSVGKFILLKTDLGILGLIDGGNSFFSFSYGLIVAHEAPVLDPFLAFQKVRSLYSRGSERDVVYLG